MIKGTTSFLVSVVARLVRSFWFHSNVLGLVFLEFGELHAQMVKMQGGDLLVKLKLNGGQKSGYINLTKVNMMCL